MKCARTASKVRSVPNRHNESKSDLTMNILGDILTYSKCLIAGIVAKH